MRQIAIIMKLKNTNYKMIKGEKYLDMMITVAVNKNLLKIGNHNRMDFGSKNILNYIEGSFLKLPKFKSVIDEEKLIINKELDNAIFKYNENLDKLKLEEFLNKKKNQDELIYKINNKLNRYNREIDEKVYQEKLASEWYEEYKNRMQKIAFSSNEYYNDMHGINNCKN